MAVRSSGKREIAGKSPAGIGKTHVWFVIDQERVSAELSLKLFLGLVAVVVVLTGLGEKLSEPAVGQVLKVLSSFVR